MKRSEMVTKLLPIYVNHLDKNDCIVIDKFVDELLTTIEKLGMLPPSIGVRMYGFQDYDIYTWEAEDVK